MFRSLVLAALLLSACSTATQRATTDPLPDAILVDPATAGWNTAALADVVSYVGGQKTTGFLIVHDRRTVAEYNWPLGADASTFRTNFVTGADAHGALIEDVASAQKSFIALLIDIAIDRKLIDIARPVSDYAGAGWSKASPEQEAKITVRNLVEMTSGLKENLTVEAEPGTKFFYNTPAYAITKKVLEGATKQSLDAISADWLTSPLGMADTSWAKRPAAFAEAGNPTGLATSPRDLAKLGQLLLDRGKGPDGQRIVSAAQLDAMLARTATNPAYGRLWWLNGGGYSLSPGARAPRTEGQLIPAAPADLVAAQGAQDRKLYVVPSLKLVVVRMGQAAPDRAFNQELWTRLMKALPK